MAKEGAIEVEPDRFHANALLVLGLVAGFTLATLVLIVTNASTFQDRYSTLVTIPSWFAAILRVVPTFALGELYFVVIAFFLGAVSVWSIIASVLMVAIGSAKRPEDWTHIGAFAMNSMSLITGLFAVMLATIVLPFTGVGALAIVAFSILLALLLLVTWWRDVKMQRKTKAMKATANSPKRANKSDAESDN